jgi:predicted glycoside hydrolase/deacetylase ChbG (UPF0249 family)
VRFLCSRRKPIEVAEIWRQQLEAFKLAFGKYPEALTTHEHVYFSPSYFQEFLRVAKEVGVADIRFAHQPNRNYTLVA